MSDGQLVIPEASQINRRNEMKEAMGNLKKIKL